MNTGMLRRLAMSVVVALSGLLAVPTSVLAITQIPPSIARAQRAVDDAQAVLDAVNAEYDKGSFGFFESVGASSALSALKTARYKSYILQGDSDDSTSLDNMLASIRLAERCNELRVQNNLSELRITDYMMATSQANTDYSDTVIGHAGQFGVGENLAWNWNSNLESGSLYAFVQWYDQEKEIYDKAIANGQQPAFSSVGHYLNIINSSYGITGVSICTRGTIFGTTYGQTFLSRSGDASYTPQEYRARLLQYVNGLKDDIDAASANLESARQALAKAWSIENVSIAPIAVQTYTGGAIKPALALTLDGITLSAGEDYTASYTSNTNAGTATVSISGAGDFKGQTGTTFQIKPANLSSATIGSIGDQQFSPGGVSPAIPISFKGKDLIADTDYTASFAGNGVLGTATVSLVGKGNFTGSRSATFRVVPANVSSASVTIAEQVYTGRALTPSPVVKLGSTTLKKDTDYTVSFANNKNAGRGTVTIVGKGNYTGTASGTFDIKRADIANATIAGLSDMQYTGAPLVPKLSAAMGGLTLNAGTDYDVAYTDNTNAGKVTFTLTGKGNYAGTKTGSYMITPVSLTKLAFEIGNQVFSGSALKPVPKVTYGTLALKSGTDFTISYANNTNAGEATLTLTGKGNYCDSKTLTFQISPVDISKAKVVVSNQVYTGSPLTPKVSLTLTGVTVPASGYTVSYANNTNAGSASVTVTGRGNYTGVAKGTFAIVRTSFFVDADPADNANHGAEVDWMGYAGISTGWAVAGGREFRGMENVARCDFAAFLYRLADLSDNGKRDDSIALSGAKVKLVLATVSDCTASTPHAAEVAWLVESGISRGWADKGKKTVSFRPMAKVARQDMAAFLYRFADLRDDGLQNRSLRRGAETVSFADVRGGDEANHALEVQWLASVGVTKGWKVGSKYQFRGTSTVARQDMAAFMNRLYSYITS